MFIDNKIPNVMVVNLRPLELAWEPTYMWNPNKNKNPQQIQKSEPPHTSHSSHESPDDYNEVPEDDRPIDVCDANDANENQKNEDKSDYEKLVERQRERFARELNSNSDNQNDS